MISICTKTQENFHLILPETVFLQSIAVYPFPFSFPEPCRASLCTPPSPRPEPLQSIAV